MCIKQPHIFNIHRLTKMTRMTLLIMTQMITIMMMIMIQLRKVLKMPLTKMMMMIHSKEKTMTMMIMMPTMMMKMTLLLVSVLVLFSGCCWIICAIFKLANESVSMKMQNDFQSSAFESHVVVIVDQII